jgi:copper chaperone CopZ
VETKSFEVPALYADHHVTELRHILIGLEGVKEVYASSAFQVVEVTYDEDKINELEIASRLDESGYLGEWTMPVELATAAQPGDGQVPYFRHTTTYETIKQTVSFAQNVNNNQRSLWRCPGMGTVVTDEEMGHAKEA